MSGDIEKFLSDEADAAEKGSDEAPGKLYRARRQASDPSQVYSVRVPVGRLERLRALAARRGKAPSALIREWVIERLDIEERRDSPNPGTQIGLVRSVDYPREFRRRLKAAAQGSVDFRRVQL
jgi:hypothetical protein